MGARAAVNFPMASSLAVAQLAAWQADIGAPRALQIECFFADWPRGWQQDASRLARQARTGRFHAGGHLPLPVPHPAHAGPVEVGRSPRPLRRAGPGRDGRGRPADGGWHTSQPGRAASASR